MSDPRIIVAPVVPGQAVVPLPEPTRVVVTQGVRGPQGEPGPIGPPGPPGALFTHTQASAQAAWTIVHNLGTYPAVTVVDSAGDAVVGDLSYDSDDQLTLTFSGAFSGVAYLVT